MLEASLSADTITFELPASFEMRELNIDELDDVAGGWGVLIPVAIAFGAGYAVGTVIYRTCLQ